MTVHDTHDGPDTGGDRPAASSRARLYRLLPWAAMAGGLFVVVPMWLGGQQPVRTTMFTVFVAVMTVAAFWSFRRGRHTPYAEASRRIAPGHAVVLWKPGCSYCERLLLQLRGRSDVTWVNVYRDSEADARVRSVNDGDQLTPTAFVGDEVLRNPSADELRERLGPW